MILLRIYLNGHERIVIYKQGGCQFESHVAGIGWIVDNDACHDWKAAIEEAESVLARVKENIALAS